jgi:dolichol-phosphate mannosyltransferase
MTLWVVTPTYNEAGNLPQLIAELRAACPEATILVVDDNSPDGSAAIAESLGAVVLRREGKMGLASAYVAGFNLALASGATRIVQMDADRSHEPADLPRLLAGEADLVLGTRWMRGGGVRMWPLHRRALSLAGSFWSRKWLGLTHRDLTGGFKAWRAPALRSALGRPLASEGYVFQVEMTWRTVQAGYRVSEVPIVFTERTDGRSKMSGRIAVEAAWKVPLLRFGE